MPDIIVHFHEGEPCTEGFGHHSSCPQPTWPFVCGKWRDVCACTHFPPVDDYVRSALAANKLIKAPFGPKAQKKTPVKKAKPSKGRRKKRK